MDFATTLKKAMIDMNIDSAKALSEKTGVSSYITRRLLKNDGTCCLNDLKTTANYLGVKTTYTNKGV
jgi:hypothetical protein